MIGVLGGPKPELNLPLVVMRQVRMQGVTVGSNQGFAAMLDAISAHKLKPVMGRVFGFGEAKEALRLMGSGQAYGKIGIALNCAAA